MAGLHSLRARCNLIFIHSTAVCSVRLAILLKIVCRICDLDILRHIYIYIYIYFRFFHIRQGKSLCNSCDAFYVSNSRRRLEFHVGTASLFRSAMPTRRTHLLTVWDIYNWFVQNPFFHRRTSNPGFLSPPTPEPPRPPAKSTSPRSRLFTRTRSPPRSVIRNPDEENHASQGESYLQSVCVEVR